MVETLPDNAWFMENKRTMNKLVYYVRHGENKANLTREFSYKKIDYSLTERGIKQAQATARALGGKGICAIYCSPLKRAVQTAEIIGSKLNLEPIHVEEFREVNVGSLEGQEPTEQNWAIYNGIMRDWREGKKTERFPDGESFVELNSRAREGLLKVMRSSVNCLNIAVVGHGGILLSVLPEICANAQSYNLETIENCSISLLELDLDPTFGALRGKILSWRNCDHLA